MEPPAKRRRHGDARLADGSPVADEALYYQPHNAFLSHDPDHDLTLRRVHADQRFKATMAHIFEKYSRNFEGIGDEIDMDTGEIVVNNGHLRHMRDEGDVGDWIGNDNKNHDHGGDNDDTEEGILLEDFIDQDLYESHEGAEGDEGDNRNDDVNDQHITAQGSPRLQPSYSTEAALRLSTLLSAMPDDTHPGLDPASLSIPAPQPSFRAPGSNPWSLSDSFSGPSMAPLNAVSRANTKQPSPRSLVSDSQDGRKSIWAVNGRGRPRKNDLPSAWQILDRDQGNEDDENHGSSVSDSEGTSYTSGWEDVSDNNQEGGRNDADEYIPKTHYNQRSFVQSDQSYDGSADRRRSGRARKKTEYMGKITWQEALESDPSDMASIQSSSADLGIQDDGISDESGLEKGSQETPKTAGLLRGTVLVQSPGQAVTAQIVPDSQDTVLSAPSYDGSVDTPAPILSIGAPRRPHKPANQDVDSACVLSDDEAPAWIFKPTISNDEEAQEDITPKRSKSRDQMSALQKADLGIIKPNGRGRPRKAPQDGASRTAYGNKQDPNISRRKTAKPLSVATKPKASKKRKFDESRLAGSDDTNLANDHGHDELTNNDMDSPARAEAQTIVTPKSTTKMRSAVMLQHADAIGDELSAANANIDEEVQNSVSSSFSKTVVRTHDPVSSPIKKGRGRPRSARKPNGEIIQPTGSDEDESFDPSRDVSGTESHSFKGRNARQLSRRRIKELPVRSVNNPQKLEVSQSQQNGQPSLHKHLLARGGTLEAADDAADDAPIPEDSRVIQVDEELLRTELMRVLQSVPLEADGQTVAARAEDAALPNLDMDEIISSVTSTQLNAPNEQTQVHSTVNDPANEHTSVELMHFSPEENAAAMADASVNKASDAGLATHIGETKTANDHTAVNNRISADESGNVDGSANLDAPLIINNPTAIDETTVVDKLTVIDEPVIIHEPTETSTLTEMAKLVEAALSAEGGSLTTAAASAKHSTMPTKKATSSKKKRLSAAPRTARARAARKSTLAVLEAYNRPVMSSQPVVGDSVITSQPMEVDMKEDVPTVDNAAKADESTEKNLTEIDNPATRKSPPIAAESPAESDTPAMVGNSTPTHSSRITRSSKIPVAETVEKVGKSKKSRTKKDRKLAHSNDELPGEAQTHAEGESLATADHAFVERNPRGVNNHPEIENPEAADEPIEVHSAKVTGSSKTEKVTKADKPRKASRVRRRENSTNSRQQETVEKQADRKKMTELEKPLKAKRQMEAEGLVEVEQLIGTQDDAGAGVLTESKTPALFKEPADVEESAVVEEPADIEVPADVEVHVDEVISTSTQESANIDEAVGTEEPAAVDDVMEVDGSVEADDPAEAVEEPAGTDPFIESGNFTVAYEEHTLTDANGSPTTASERITEIPNSTDSQPSPEQPIPRKKLSDAVASTPPKSVTKAFRSLILKTPNRKRVGSHKKSPRQSLLSLVSDADGSMDMDELSINHGPSPYPLKSDSTARRIWKSTPLTTEVFRTPTKKRMADPMSPGSVIQTPGGTLRMCGVDGFACGRDFCFTCL